MKTRIYGGKRYKLHGRYTTERIAEKVAVALRKEGYLARVAVEGSVFVVYEYIKRG